MKTICAAIVFGLTLAVAQVSAQPQNGSDEQREMVRKQMQERIKQVDANNDGIISRSEFMSRAEQQFNRMDANSDGNITEDERSAIRDMLRDRNGAGSAGETFP